LGDTWIIDLRHFLTPKGALATSTRQPNHIARYWTAIVAQASNFDEPLTLQCRRRPQHRPCLTVLKIDVNMDTDAIHWRCPRCGDNGIINGWQDTFWDAS
jgi:hypothetical protein